MASASWSWTTWGAFLVLVVFWGLNFPFAELGLQSASPLWLATLRAATGTAATLAIATARGTWGTLDRLGQRDALLLGVPNTGLFFGLWFSAAREVSPGLVAIVIYTFPLWVALLSGPILAYRLAGVQWVAVAAGFLGVALISRLGLAGGASLSLPAGLELLGAAIAWAVGTVLFQRRFRREELVEANSFQLVGGSVSLLVATLLFSPFPLPTVTGGLVLSVLWMGVLGTAAAYLIWFTLLGRTEAATLSAYVFLVPVVALAASVAYFGERLSTVQLVGVALVLAGIYLIGRSRREPRAAVRSSAEP